MGIKTKSQFYSVLLDKFHLRTNLIALFFANFVFKRKLITQNFEILRPKGTFHTNPDSEWENENIVKRISL
jgi:hypothetical protein